MKKPILFFSAVLLSAACSTEDSPPASVSSMLEFGPCKEFIGGYLIPEATARLQVPDGYTLDVSEQGMVLAQVRTINCESISIEHEDGTVEEGGENILYQLGVSVKAPVELDPNPFLADAVEVTEYHSYAFNTLTSFEPLARALERAGIGGVHYVEDLVFNTGDNDPNACELVPIEGRVSSPPELALSFSGMVRDLGLEPEDGCEFGPDDITVSERALWYTDGAFGMAVSDTSVPNSQILLFNGDPRTGQPYPVTYTPVGTTMQSIGADVTQFSFTLTGLLERGEVFTTLRAVLEE